MRKILVLISVILLLISLPCVSLAYHEGDDYPLEYRELPLDAVLDCWQFYNRECTSFVAWCLNSRNGVEFHNQYSIRADGSQGSYTVWGHAGNWASAARSLGYTVDTNPAVGSVYCTGGGAYGHVAWVTKVENNHVWLEQYNDASRTNWRAGEFSSFDYELGDPAYSGVQYIHIADIGQPVYTEYDEAMAGSWYIRSAAFEDRKNGYLCVDGLNDTDGTSIVISNYDNTSSWSFALIQTDNILNGYQITPSAITSGRLFNVGADRVKAGDPANIFHDVHSSTQWWKLSKNGSRYYIHSKNNPSRVLTVDGTSVKMMPFTGSNNQLWEIISDQEDPTRVNTYGINYYINSGKQYSHQIDSVQEVFASENKKRYEDYRIIETWPTRKGYFFQGWSTDENATESNPMFAPGSLYVNDAPLNLYAVWKSSSEIESRSIVLAIDNSSSMGGTPIEETKKAADKFINRTYGGNVELALVRFSTSASVSADFSASESKLHEEIANFGASGGTNIAAALLTSNDLLKESQNKKIIILMSDGYPEDGIRGDDLIDLANQIKERGVLIYTLGFYQASTNRAMQQQLMEQLASEGCHYEVDSAENLEIFFTDVSDQIKGERYLYIRIACPVEVSVEYESETLCSEGASTHQRASFGTLALEDSPSRNGEKIKVLRLQEGPSYAIRLWGTGIGTMDYTMGIMDQKGDYTDFRRFQNIPITEKTSINTVAMQELQTTLRVDHDGDRKDDEIYNACANSQTIILNSRNILAVGIPVVLSIAIIILSHASKKTIRQKSITERQG